MYNIVFVVYDFLLVNFHFNLFENVNALSNDDSSMCPLFLMKGKEYCFLSFEFKMMTIFMSLMIFHVQTVPCVPLFLKRVLFSFIWNWNIDNFYVYLNFMYSRNIVQIRKASKKNKKKLDDFFVFKNNFVEISLSTSTYTNFVLFVQQFQLIPT